MELDHISLEEAVQLYRHDVQDLSIFKVNHI